MSITRAQESMQVSRGPGKKMKTKMKSKKVKKKSLALTRSLQTEVKNYKRKKK